MSDFTILVVKYDGLAAQRRFVHKPSLGPLASSARGLPSESGVNLHCEPVNRYGHYMLLSCGRLPPTSRRSVCFDIMTERFADVVHNFACELLEAEAPRGGDMMCFVKNNTAIWDDELVFLHCRPSPHSLGLGLQRFEIHQDGLRAAAAPWEADCHLCGNSTVQRVYGRACMSLYKVMLDDSYLVAAGGRGLIVWAPV